jgi:hypothetical protein
LALILVLVAGGAVVALGGLGLGAGFVHGVQEGLAGDAVQFVFTFAFDGGRAVRQELADVSECHGVLAIDAAEGELGERLPRKQLTCPAEGN